MDTDFMREVEREKVQLVLSIDIVEMSIDGVSNIQNQLNLEKLILTYCIYYFGVKERIVLQMTNASVSMQSCIFTYISVKY